MFAIQVGRVKVLGARPARPATARAAYGEGRLGDERGRARQQHARLHARERRLHWGPRHLRQPGAPRTRSSRPPTRRRARGPPRAPAPAPAPAPARAPLTRARPPDLGVRARHGVRLRHRDQRAVSPVVCPVRAARARRALRQSLGGRRRAAGVCKRRLAQRG